MPLARTTSTLFYIGAVNLVLMLSGNAAAQTVWSGLSYTFTKQDNTDARLEENQDRITDNVWITRQSIGFGLLNAVTECDIVFGCTYTHNFSPEDTEWANGWLNPGETIAATNWQQLNFSDWEDAYDNRIGQTILNPSYRDAVVHLFTDDIYLDLRFTAWSQQSGGGFSYQRATAPSTPQPTGDYNENGGVDAADYVVWRKTLNQSAVPAGSGADGDGDGTIDSDDYDFWTARFGNTVPGSGGGAVAVAAPEPAAAILLLIGITCFRVITRSRRGSSRQAWNSVT